MIVKFSSFQILIIRSFFYFCPFFAAVKKPFSFAYYTTCFPTRENHRAEASAVSLFFQWGINRRSQWSWRSPKSDFSLSKSRLKQTGGSPRQDNNSMCKLVEANPPLLCLLENHFWMHMIASRLQRETVTDVADEKQRTNLILCYCMSVTCPCQ